MANYPYSPLDLTEPSIRLLHIRKGWWAEDIICQLCESYADQERGVPYTALSYTWGGVQHQHEAGNPCVLVDGHQISLTKNLYWALRHIRRPDQDAMLWVDAICINQDDLREKGHQVKQMGNIYKGAEEVLIWLGLSNDGIGSVLESISWIDEKATTEVLAMGGEGDWMSSCRRFMGGWSSNIGPDALSWAKQALVELLTRPWFKRVWILQEIANARTARIQCGLSSCPARTFALMPSLLELTVDQHTQAVLDIMPRFRKKTWWSSDRQLHVLLNKFSESQAFQPRDNIYALLGMSEDACDPETFYPCYEKPDDEVFRDTASFLLFGKIVGPSYSFPSFQFLDLRLPTSQLAGDTLKWALGKKKKLSRRKTADLLVRRMNEGWPKTAAVLLSLVTDQAQLERVRKMLAHQGVDITVGFDHVSDILVFAIASGSVVVSETITLQVGYRTEVRFK